ncbi:MAG: hypothetical protein HQL72_03855 [Magnetococcales bacterium]|nr:hypothetical protein [Magnetococcales bacterium]
MKSNASRHFLVAALLLALFLLGQEAVGGERASESVVKHYLNVEIDPGTKKLKVTDTLVIPNRYRASLEQGGVRLNSGLKVTAWKGAKVSAPEKSEPCGEGVCTRYFLTMDSSPASQSQLTVRYEGVLDAPSNPIEERGVALSGGDYWYPSFSADFLQFELKVKLPKAWKSVSQGSRIFVGSSKAKSADFSWSGWQTHRRTDEIHLVAGPWFEYEQRMADGTHLLAFFRQDEPELAKRYLQLSAGYIELYRELLGPYPYKKFAVVENFHQTGLGMPSFTLLGSRVMRLPFILHTSLPHEILHNWWGNGVFVDYEKGNWSEGLTAYLSDYWLKERRGEGMIYRRNILIGYGDFVRESNEIPLTGFRARHNEASQAVGYGKGAFFFHQLRQTLGDTAFIAGLQHFYRINRFKRASYATLQQSMALASGEDLSGFFTQWTTRTDLPSLQIKQASSQEKRDRHYTVSFTLEQSQTSQKPFSLRVPLSITVVGEPQPLFFYRKMEKIQQHFEITVPLRPIRLDVDASYDLFRTLHSQERPITLSRAFGAKRGLIIYPSESSKKEVEIYRNVALAWNVGITPDDALSQLPRHRAVWLFGKSNRFEPLLLNSLYRFEVGEGVQTKRIQIRGEWYDDRKQAIVLVGRNPGDPKSALVQIMARPDKFPALLPILARKLPHYGQYSYLVFRSEDGSNQVKGQWPSAGSALSVTFDSDGESVAAKVAAQPRPSTPLAVPVLEAPTKPVILKKRLPKLLIEEEKLSPSEVVPPTQGEPPAALLKKKSKRESLFPEPVQVPLSSQ